MYLYNISIKIMFCQRLRKYVHYYGVNKIIYNIFDFFQGIFENLRSIKMLLIFKIIFFLLIHNFQNCLTIVFTIYFVIILSKITILNAESRKGNSKSLLRILDTFKLPVVS